jgi:hypothetical protein
MLIEYVLDHARQRLSIIARDPAGVAEVLDWLARQAADGAWAYASLDDLRPITLNPTTADVQRILDQVTTLSATHGRRGPVAVVATDPALFGMARVYAALSDMAAGEIGVFYEIARAEQWLAERTRVT